MSSRSKIKEIELTQDIARFAWKIHTGRFTDHELEKRLLQIGQNLNQHVDADSNLFKDCLSKLNIQPKEPNKRNVLHILTRAYVASGHTKLLSNIVQMDPSSSHHLIVTNQGATIFPERLATLFEDDGRQAFHLHHENVLINALLVRSISQQKADIVFLHVHPDDPLPLLAFAVTDCPPIAFVNHADHTYWLGTSIADLIVNLREKAEDLSYKRRAARQCLTLPIPLHDHEPSMAKQTARRELNIHNDQILAITMGASYKFTPNAHGDFFKTIVKALDKIPELHLKIIGVSEDDDLEKMGYIKHKRMQLLGIIKHPEKYQIAADVIIDPIPYGSYTALLESVVQGCYPFMMKNAIPLFNLSEDPGLKGMVQPAENEPEFISSLADLCKSREELERKTELIRKNLLSWHAGKDWHSALDTIYQYLYSAKHNPGSRGENPSMATEEDFMLSVLSEKQLDKECEMLMYGLINKSQSLTLREIFGLASLIKRLSYPRTILGVKIILRILMNKFTGRVSYIL